MTTFEKCKAIRNILLIRLAETISYNWDDSFKLKQLSVEDIKETVNRWEKEHGSFLIDPRDLTTEETKELGFGSWSKESQIKLIPLWLFPFLIEEFECESINGKKYNLKSDLDTDHRFGCIAYGIIPK